MFVPKICTTVRRERLTRLVFDIFAGVVTPVLLLQLYNTVFLGAFWPFFAGIVYELVTAMAQLPG